MAIYPDSLPFLVVSVIYTILFIPFITLFIIRRNLEPINSRGWELVLVSAFSGFLQFHVISWETFVSIDPSLVVSCHFLYWPTAVFVPIFGVPYFLRSAVLYTKYRFNLSKMLDKPEEIWLTRNKFISNPAFTLGIMVVSFLVTIIVAGGIQFYPGAFFPPNSQWYCLDNMLLYIVIFHVLVVIVLYIIAIIKTWGINDAFEIKTELKVLIIVVPALFIPFVIRTATSFLTPYVDQSYFSLPIIGSCFLASVVYPVYLSFKLQRSKYERMSFLSNDDIKAIVNNTDTLFRFVMESNIMRKEFQQYCVEAWCVENFLFYRDVYEFTKLEDVSEMFDEAKKIAEMYIGEETPRQVNVDVHAVNSVVNRIQGNDIDKDLFHLALSQVETQMKQDTLSHWKQTSNFADALSKAQQEEAIDLFPIKFSIDVN